METGKRIILTNESPNDQGGVIINKSIDWSRFNSNPVMLYHHGRDPEVRDKPIGHWADLMFDGVNYSALPVFSDTCPYWIVTLYTEGNLKASSIGGICIKKTTGKMVMNPATGKKEPELLLDQNGCWTSEYFLTYEASITPIGSNADALQMNSAYFYNPEEILSETEILTLNTKYMPGENTEANGEVKEVVKEVEQTELAAKPADKTEKPEDTTTKTELTVEETEPDKNKKVSHVVLDSEKIGIVEKLLSAVKSIFESPIHKEPDGDEPVKEVDLPTGAQPNGAQTEAAAETEEMAAAKKAEKDKEDAETKKKEEAEMSGKIEACNNEAELSAIETELGSEIPQVVKDAINQKKSKFNIKLSSKMPEIKTKEELAADGQKLAEKKVIVMGGANVPSFTELRSTEEGRKIVSRVSMSGGKTRNIEDHMVVLNSILQDPRYRAVVEKMTFTDKSGNRSIPKANLVDLAARFESGQVDFMNFRNGKLQNYAELTATDDLLASPDLIAVEWLNIFLYKLFPSAEWKSEIPTFAATSTGKNKGLIYTNINADPAIYQGSRPVNPAVYEYDDLAVSLTLSSFYLQPMLWQPLVMNMLRYDQQATGWAQAMMKFNSVIDNYLIYTLASQIAAVATPTVVKTKGAAFTIAAATDPDAFLLNAAFTGSLAKPTLNDLLVIDQVFKKQNFAEGTKFVTVQDPTMDRYITSDPETKSLLTRFVNSEGDELVSYKNAKLRTRSQVALYNPATGGVVDPTGVVPAGAVSAGLAFVPDQVGLGIANLDVFMIQVPASYGYEMSADIRAGASLMRKNGNGTALYTYGEPTV
jgi:hypothetical protein